MLATGVHALDFAYDQTLTVTGTTSANRAGEVVAATSTYLAAGAPTDDTLGTDAGAVYLYEKVGSTWTFRQKITASDGAAGDQFGASLAMDGTTLLVGSPFDDLVSATDAGSVYSFDLDTGTWLQTQKITMAAPVNYERFGTSVDLTSQRAVVGAPGYNGATSATTFGRGAVSVWDRQGINWGNQYLYTYASPVSAATRAAFGNSVALSGDKIAVGAPYDYAANTGQGGNAGSMSVLAYNSGTSTWASEARFYNTTPVASDFYGFSVDIQGNTLVTANYSIQTTAPRIFTYTYSAGAWSAPTVIIPTTVATTGKRYIGRSVEIAPDQSSILIGSNVSMGATDSVGRVFVLKPNDTTTTWEQVQELTSPDAPSSSGWFGYDVAYAGSSPVVGSPMVTAITNTRGAVYTYTTGDSTPPSVTLSSTSSNYVNSPYSVVIDITEPVIGFTQDDITITSGAVLSNFTQINPTQYSVLVTPSADKPYTMGIDAGKMQDAAGNGNSASNSLVRIYDTTKPVASVVVPTEAAYFSSPTIDATVRVNDSNGNLTGLASDDVAITNGTISGFTAKSVGTYTEGTFTITPTTQGPVSFYVKSDAVTDQAGNGSTASGVRTIYYDTTQPTPSFSTPLNPTNASPFPVTLSFDESVADIRDVSVGQVGITGGTISNFQRVTDQQYTFDVTPTGVGTISLSYAANQVADKAGNRNIAATNLDVVFDDFGPEVVIDASSSDPTNQTPIVFSVTFSEPVTGLSASDFSITNGAASSLSQQTSTSYSLTVSPNANGSVSVSLPALSANDSIGNGNQLSNTKTITYDTVRPNTSITHTYISPSGASPLNFTIKFSESVSDLTPSGLQLTNATFSSLTKVDSKEYTLSVIPSDGQVTVRVLDGAVQDAAGNQSREDTTSLTSDRTPPAGTVDPLHTNDTRPSITGTISEPVNSVMVSINGTSFTATVNNSAKTWAVNRGLFGPFADGIYDVSVSIIDLAGNSGTDTTANELTIDTDQPVVTVAAAAPITNQNPIVFNVTSTRDIYGLTSSDFVVSGGNVSSIIAMSQKQYRVEVSPSADGKVTLQLTANSVVDDAGNQNPASNIAEATYDSIRPSLTLSGNTTAVNTAFDVTLVTSEDIHGLTTSDITVARGSATAVTKQADQRYTIHIQPSSEGLVTVQIPAGMVFDSANNSNTASNVFQRLYDITPPVIPTVNSQVVEQRQPKLTGTFDSANTVTLRVAVGSRQFQTGTIGSPIVLNGNQWQLDFSQTNIKLEFGVYDIRVTTLDAAGNSSVDITQNELIINSAGTITGTVDPQITSNTRPEITGTVSRQNAAIKVKIRDNIYTATNNRDGSWTLPGNTIQPLSDGVYDIELTLTDGSLEGSDLTTNELTIDTAAPRGTFTRIVTKVTSPGLSGTIDTSNTNVRIEIEGKIYDAVVSGNQWNILAGTINPALIPGAHTAIMHLERNGKQGMEVVRRAITIPSDTVPPIEEKPNPETQQPKPLEPSTPTPKPTPYTSANPAAQTIEDSKITQGDEDTTIRPPQSEIKPTRNQPGSKEGSGAKTSSLAHKALLGVATVTALGATSAFLIGWKRKRKKDEQELV